MSISDVVFSGSMWVILKRTSFWCWDEDADLEMDPNCRSSMWPPLAAMQAVKRLVKFSTCWCVLVAAVPRWLQSELINRPGLQLEFMVLFQHGTPNMIIQWVEIWRVRGQWFAWSQSCMTRAMWAGVPTSWIMKCWLPTCCLLSQYTLCHILYKWPIYADTTVKWTGGNFLTHRVHLWSLSVNVLKLIRLFIHLF